MSFNPNKARAIFIEAVGKVPPEQWEAFLSARCGEDAELRRHVHHLLQAHVDAGSFLDRPAVPPVDTGAYRPGAGEKPASRDQTESRQGPGTLIGQYKLLQQIGEGGMGAVFMAEQTQPVRRTVALKLVKPGMDSKQVLARFEAERQALALMDHPNIARVLDAGTTDDGRPYFVMELVKGVPITRHCDEHRLAPKQRLELFLPVCQAVQHAHQKGVIHRDLKPSNVLVAEYDDRPVPKVIDFGVAKATGPKLTERTMFTEFGQLVGTLEYMSPEQAKFNALDIDTRTDIYSLGVLLYELLTGSTPLDRKRLHQAGLDEVLRMIREEEPPKPSTRLRTTEGLPGIAADRGLGPRQVRGLVRGELDWIVMKCLEKDRNRRYETAGSLARDVERYLADEPVLACPPSSAYRLRKFVRRNKAAVAAATVVLLSLVGGVVGTTWGLLRAVAERDEKDKAQKTAEANLRKSQQTVNDYFTLVSENTLLYHPALEPLRRQLLQGALDHYHRFTQEHRDDPALQGELAATYLRIAQLDHDLHSEEDWLAPFQRCVAIVEDLLQKKADVSSLQGLRRGIRRFNSTTPFWVRQPEEALRTMEKARGLWEELVRQDPSAPGFAHDLAAVCHVIGNLLLGAERFDEAVRSYQSACDLWCGMDPGAVHYRAALTVCLYDLGLALEGGGRLAQAVEASRRGLEVSQKLVDDFPEVPVYGEFLALSYTALGSKLEKAGQPKEAVSAYRQCLVGLEKLAGAFPTVVRFRHRELLTRLPLADLLWALGRRAEAAEQYRRGLALAEGLGPENPDVRDTLAWLLATCPDPQRRDAKRAVEVVKTLVERAPQEGSYRSTLGAAYFGTGDYPAAVRALEEAVRLPNGQTGVALYFLAMAHWQLGQKDLARNCYNRAVTEAERRKARSAETRRLRVEAEKLLGITGQGK
jgi:serine/threonine protein kinase